MCTKTKIINKFKSTIEKNNLIEKNDTIIVGASGGPDSQFLIYLLNEVKDYYKINIVLAHLNHLHRLDANEDEKLVEKTGEKLGFKTFIDHKSMDDYAKKEKISAENAGRILRYFSHLFIYNLIHFTCIIFFSTINQVKNFYF